MEQAQQLQKFEAMQAHEIGLHAVKEAKMLRDQRQPTKAEKEARALRNKLRQSVESDAIFGNQSRLPNTVLTQEELAKQKKNAIARKETEQKKSDKNFYTLDTETTGFNKNELVQFAAALFIDGKEVSHMVKSIMPEGNFTESARKTNGLSR